MTYIIICVYNIYVTLGFLRLSTMTSIRGFDSQAENNYSRVRTHYKEIR